MLKSPEKLEMFRYELKHDTNTPRFLVPPPQSLLQSLSLLFFLSSPAGASIALCVICPYPACMPHSVPGKRLYMEQFGPCSISGNGIFLNVWFAPLHVMVQLEREDAGREIWRPRTNCRRSSAFKPRHGGWWIMHYHLSVRVCLCDHLGRLFPCSMVSS